MRTTFAIAAALVLAAAPAARAQDVRPAPRDTLRAAADTTAEAIERRLLEELARPDTTAVLGPEAPAAAPATPRTLNPDLSLIADFLADLSPEEATLEGGDRFQVREIEIGIQGAVDPYFRYDAFVGVHGDEVELEEGYATTLGLPAGLQVKLGKFLLPFGKVNLTHRPELHTIDYPLYVQEYFGEEGLKSAGAWLSVIGAPLGFYQEITVVATNGAEANAHGEEEEAEEDQGKDLIEDLADRLFVTHLKSSIDLSGAANLELGGSLATAHDEDSGRTTFYGIDAIWRWKPPRLAKYRSAVLQAELAWRAPEEGDTRLGAFVFGQWQLTRRSYAGARWDYVELPDVEADAGATSIRAGQLVLRYFPTEFSQLRASYERKVPNRGEALDRLLFQATFALGPHRPHAF